ncbi:MAG: septum formation inhibitor Maf, partial [Mycobacteriaceae bacterium]
GWFVDGIEGDPSSVVGIGLPLLRGLLAEVGVPVHSLWSPQARA